MTRMLRRLFFRANRGWWTWRWRDYWVSVQQISSLDTFHDRSPTMVVDGRTAAVGDAFMWPRPNDPLRPHFGQRWALLVCRDATPARLAGHAAVWLQRRQFVPGEPPSAQTTR